nr:hypothetical protein OG513_02190 [Streptomyces sp. NBC_00998]
MEVVLIPAAAFGARVCRLGEACDVLDLVASDRDQSADAFRPERGGNTGCVSAPVEADEDRVARLQLLNTFGDVGKPWMRTMGQPDWGLLICAPIMSSDVSMKVASGVISER